MPTYMVQITNTDGTTSRHYGEHADAVTAAQAAKTKFPAAARIEAEPYSAWRARAQAGVSARHDTEKLPCGGFYFAPGADDDLVPRHRWRMAPRSWIERVALDVIKLLLIGGAIGAAAGYLQAKGWPL